MAIKCIGCLVIVAALKGGLLFQCSRNKKALVCLMLPDQDRHARCWCSAVAAAGSKLGDEVTRGHDAKTTSYIPSPMKSDQNKWKRNQE